MIVIFTSKKLPIIIFIKTDVKIKEIPTTNIRYLVHIFTGFLMLVVGISLIFTSVLIKIKEIPNTNIRNPVKI
jgi:uncharacterized membrane protein YkvI